MWWSRAGMGTEVAGAAVEEQDRREKRQRREGQGQGQRQTQQRQTQVVWAASWEWRWIGRVRCAGWRSEEGWGAYAERDRESVVDRESAICGEGSSRGERI